MAFKAAGAYIARLRKDAKLSRFALARKVGTSDSNMMRIEQGDQEPKGALLGLIVRELNANVDELFDFFINEETEEQEGIRKAEEWIQNRSNTTSTTPDIHSDVHRLLNRMSEYELGRWVSMGERLIDERSKPK